MVPAWVQRNGSLDGGKGGDWYGPGGDESSYYRIPDRYSVGWEVDGWAGRLSVSVSEGGGWADE